MAAPVYQVKEYAEAAPVDEAAEINDDIEDEVHHPTLITLIILPLVFSLSISYKYTSVYILTSSVTLRGFG